MKKILCGYEKCSGRRVHWCNPYTDRDHQEVEVGDAYEGKAYCSLECAAMDGALKLSEPQPQKQ